MAPVALWDTNQVYLLKKKSYSEYFCLNYSSAAVCKLCSREVRILFFFSWYCLLKSPELPQHVHLDELIKFNGLLRTCFLILFNVIKHMLSSALKIKIVHLQCFTAWYSFIVAAPVRYLELF